MFHTLHNFMIIKLGYLRHALKHKRHILSLLQKEIWFNFQFSFLIIFCIFITVFWHLKDKLILLLEFVGFLVLSLSLFCLFVCLSLSLPIFGCLYLSISLPVSLSSLSSLSISLTLGLSANHGCLYLLSISLFISLTLVLSPWAIF